MYCDPKFETEVPDLDRDALQRFTTLARTLHFGRASRECHVSPSALSRSIQRLEDEVGHRLFDRDRRSVSLTTAGRTFARYADEAISRWDELRGELDREQGALTGRIGIFATVTACYSFLPERLARFRNTHPGVELRLHTGNAEEALSQLADGEVDVAVAPLPERPPARFESHPITRTPLVFVAPSGSGELARLLSKRPVPWNEIPLVLPRFGLARRHADRWLRARRVKPNVESEVAGNEAVLSLVALGCGVGVVPKLVLDHSPLRSHVRALSVRPALPSFDVAFCARRRGLAEPVVGAFWDSIREA